MPGNGPGEPTDEERFDGGDEASHDDFDATPEAAGRTLRRQPVKVAVVVQRYGAEINGGAEQHARYVAEHLAPHVQVEVLTTCARDYITWKNELPEGVETINGVPVRRFAVARERDPIEFAKWSHRVFETTHSLRDELAWLDAEGPTSPALIDYITRHEARLRLLHLLQLPLSPLVLRNEGGRRRRRCSCRPPNAMARSDSGSSRRYSAAFARSCTTRTKSAPRFRASRTITSVPGVVVGVGSEIPAQSSAGRFRQKFGLRDRFAIYVGRIDQNKGCAELFEYFEHYSAGLVDGMHLVLIGAPIIPIPEHPRIHHLGFVDDQDKFDAIAAAELLIMPSYLESLSMVALEAWALGKPVLANAKCEVLQGQCLRSNAGLFYENFREFSETLRVIDTNPSLQAALGRNGRAFFERHYSWPVIEKKYLDMLERLSKEPAANQMEPLPGWFARRRRIAAARQQRRATVACRTRTRDSRRPRPPTAERPAEPAARRRDPRRRRPPSSPRSRADAISGPTRRQARPDNRPRGQSQPRPEGTRQAGPARRPRSARSRRSARASRAARGRRSNGGR